MDHKRFLELVGQFKGTINDAALFCSNYTKGYFNDIAKAIVLRFGRKKSIKVEIINMDNDIIAQTDGDRILININNKYYYNSETRLKRFSIIKALFTHELGHVLFTNMKLINILCFQLIEKRIVHKTGMVSVEEVEEIYLFLNNKSKREQFWKLFIDIQNRIEDGYIEKRVMKEIPGYSNDLLELRKQQLQKMYSFSELVDIKEANNLSEEEFNVIVLLNLILTYSKYNKVKADKNDLEIPVLRDFLNIIPYIDKALDENNSTLRITICIDISYRLFSYLSKVIKDDNVNERIFNTIKIIPGSSSNPKGSTEPVDEEGLLENIGLENIFKVDKNIKDAQPRSVQEREFITKEIDSILITDEQGMVDFHFNNEGNGYSKSDSDIERILIGTAEEEAKVKMEQEEIDNINRQLKAINYTDVHKHINSSIIRITNVPQYLKEKYDYIAPPLLEISRNMQKNVISILKSKRAGKKDRRLYMGNSINPAEIYKEDGKLFEKNRRHSKKEKIAICYIGDESTSMSKSDRITYERATAIIFEDFCRNLNIPHMIYGHSTCGDDVNMYSYAEFDSIDNNNKYRIMDMACRGCNRDGYVLIYCAEKLLKVNAENKIIVIICDGKPNHTGYSGSLAERDVTLIVNKYRNMGIRIYALAIGDDKDTLKRMYGKSYVDITNLKCLPNEIIKIIRNNLV